MKAFTAPKLALATAIAATVGATAPAMAQLEEVLVTAQKREQTLQDVPASVSVVSGESMRDFIGSGENIRALAGRVPSLQIESSNGRQSPRFYIRGLGNTDFDVNANQPVSLLLDDVTLENGCLFFIPGSHKKTTFENPGITRNMDAVFDFYPEFRQSASVPAVMKAGSCSFHNGLAIHGAHANMTPGFRRAMTCAYMPEGSVFNGEQNILSDEQFSRLKVGDPMDDDQQNPLIFLR